jgi:molybdate transport system regulatory protein
LERSGIGLFPEGTMVSLKLRSRQWIVDEEGKIIIGEGRKTILENIEKTGSINQTAKIMKMSYKGVWSKIKATESSMQVRIVDADRKRGSRLTKEGKELLEKYGKLKKGCVEADDKIFKALFKEEG